MLGQPNFRPHVIEFIRGVGVKRNGIVVQDSGGTGPFTWVLPDDVCQVVADATSAGGSGGGGYNTGAGLGGGGGGAAGIYVMGLQLVVVPGASLTVTVGAKATGGVAGANGGLGGETSIAGLLQFFMDLTTEGKLTLKGAQSGQGKAGTASGGKGGDIADDFGGGAGSAAGASPGFGGMPPKPFGTMSTTEFLEMWGARFSSMGGYGGAGSNTTAANPGGNTWATPQVVAGIHQLCLNHAATQNVGDSTGTVSRGAGGMGGYGPFGRFGQGGAGGAVGGAASGFGCGGGGGGGGAAGGDSSDGYVRLVYWSAK